MSSLEQRIRARAAEYPEPSNEAMRLARAAFIAAATQRSRGARVGGLPTRRFVLRPLLVGLVFVVSVGAAFGSGFSVGSTDQSPSATAVADGPGFLPAPGWNVLQTGLRVPPEGPSAIAANVPLVPRDIAIGGLPTRTINRLGPQGILLHANFIPSGQIAAVDRQFPKRSTPLRIRDARLGSLEGLTNPGRTLRLLAQVGGYNIDALIIFGARKPGETLIAEADAELGRLVVPGCPDLLPVGPNDRRTASQFVFRWIKAHYLGAPTDLRGAERRAYVVGLDRAPHAASARSACGSKANGHLMEVVVSVPRRAQRVTGRLPLAYFAYKTSKGWRIWRQA